VSLWRFHPVRRVGFTSQAPKTRPSATLTVAEATGTVVATDTDRDVETIDILDPMRQRR